MPYSVARQQGGTSVAEKVWGAFDTTTDALDAVGVIKLPKWFSVGKTAVTICNDLSNGEYLDAAGTLILSLTKYGFLLDIGTAIINTEYMQTGMARLYAQEYMDIQRKIYYEEKSRNPDCDKIRRLESAQKAALDNFKNCMDNLGIKYNKQITPQWKQGH